MKSKSKQLKLVIMVCRWDRKKAQKCKKQAKIVIIVTQVNSVDTTSTRYLILIEYSNAIENTAEWSHSRKVIFKGVVHTYELISRVRVN